MVREEGLEKIGVSNWSDIQENFVGADLLLGNGFSLNLTGHFNYESLFKEFINNCTPEECKIFKSFAINNFELIQEILINTLEVNKLFKIKTNDKIENAIELLKSGLIKAIKNNHPLSSQIDGEQLRRISIQLNGFGDVFSLNYDLFLYHIILKMKDKSEEENRGAPYSDYFWGEYDEPFKQFMGDDYPHRKHIHYLHGALFLFEKPPDTIKLIRGHKPKELVALIGDIIKTGVMPLFVSEGKSNDKLKTINRSNYLSFAREQLEKSQNSLVIFGSSLSAQDAHIVNTINHRKNNRELAIAIHIGTKSKNELEKVIKRFKGNFKQHKIYFFDSETIFKF